MLAEPDGAPHLPHIETPSLAIGLVSEGVELNIAGVAVGSAATWRPGRARSEHAPTKQAEGGWLETQTPPSISTLTTEGVEKLSEVPSREHPLPPRGPEVMDRGLGEL